LKARHRVRCAWFSTFWNKAKDTGLQDAGVFKHAQIGLFLTLAGFLIAGIAGVFGPRRD